LENRPFYPTTPYLAPSWGETVGISPSSLVSENWAIVWRCLRDPTFSCFGTMVSCDGQTERQTNDDSIASRGKTDHSVTFWLLVGRESKNVYFDYIECIFLSHI